MNARGDLIEELTPETVCRAYERDPQPAFRPFLDGGEKWASKHGSLLPHARQRSGSPEGCRCRGRRRRRRLAHCLPVQVC